jgi:RimJ/RimL family protein N-acetyltransferase
MKLAQAAVHTFVEHCFSNGYTPYWDCMTLNAGSNAVARKVGFHKEFTFKGYEFKI